MTKRSTRKAGGARREPRRRRATVGTPATQALHVRLTPEQCALVELAIRSGRLTQAEDAVRGAMALWEEHERRRLEILILFDEAEGSVARGEGTPITKASMKKLADNVTQRLRGRKAERADSR